MKLLVSSEQSDTMVAFYTEGGCKELALNLQHLGFLPCFLFDEIHYGVFIDAEREYVLDIQGIWRVVDWISEWEVFGNEDQLPGPFAGKIDSAWTAHPAQTREIALTLAKLADRFLETKSLEVAV